MIRIFLILLAFLAAAPAQAAVEISFYSHEMTPVGIADVEFPHAFVVMRGTPDRGGKPIAGNWGFTAAKISPLILMGPVKGEMSSVDAAYIADSKRHMTLKLSDARLAAVQATYKRWAAVRGKSYDLETRNCVHFIAELAKAAGLDTPNDPSLMKRPDAYLSAMAARNRKT